MDVSEQPVSARERSRIATRERLIASARHLFALRGLHRVTTHEIARGAGVAAGTFYLHFSDKESIFREIAYDGINRLRVHLAQARGSAHSVRSAVQAHAEALVGFAEAESDLVNMLFGRDHSAAELESEIMDYSATVMTENLIERRALGIFPSDLDPAVTAQALTGMFSRTLAWWIEDRSRASRDDVIRTLVRVQLAGTYTE